MELWHILLIGHVILMPIGNYLGKVFIHELHPYQILFYQYIASFITISTYIFFLKPSSSFFDIPFWLIIIGFMYAIGISSMYRAKKESLSKSVVMKNTTHLITIILAMVFLGEWKIISIFDLGGIKKLIGLLLVIITAYLFAQKKLHKGSEETFNFRNWIKWISINVIVIGVAKFIVKYAVELNEPLLVLRLQYVGSFIVIAFLCFYTKKDIFIGWKNILGTSIIGVFISSSLALLYTALSKASATQVLPIASTAIIIITTLIGVIFFKEKITKRTIVPFVLGIIGIFLLK